MAELLSDKLRKQIEESPYEDDFTAGLYQVIDGMSDKDLREYIWANRQYYMQMIPQVVKDIPDLNEYVNTRPNFGNTKIDLAKAFNDPDIFKNMDKLDAQQIDYVARKNGMNYQDFVNQMYAQKLQHDRTAIAKGEDLGGWFDSPEAFAHNLGGAVMGVFGPRQQEAIMRGEEPGAKDYVGDIGQQALYLMPWGRAIGGAGKAAMLARGASNFAAPLATETYDAAVYEDDNPRGEFSTADVLQGGAVNLAAPLGVNAAVNKVSRIAGAGNAAKQGMKELGVGKSQQQIFDEFNQKWTPQSTAQMYNTKLQNGSFLTPEQQLAAAQFNREYKATYDVVRKKLLNGEKLTDEDLRFIDKVPEFKEYFLRGSAPTEAQLMTEDAVKNWGTNTFGDVMYGNGQTNIPYVGTGINNYLNEQRDIKKSKKAEEESKKRIQSLYGVKF